MASDEQEEKNQDPVLKALDLALLQGVWDGSNFLRVIGKNLQHIRDEYLQSLDEHSRTINPVSSNQMASTDPLQQEVFVALYTTEGSVLSAWERIISNLPSQIISRPIYTREEDAVAMIKTKENKVNEAYVAVFINRDDILVPAQDKIPRDKLGKPLIALKNKAISLSNINRFVHLSSVYKVVNNRLMKTSPSGG